MVALYRFLVALAISTAIASLKTEEIAHKEIVISLLRLAMLCSILDFVNNIYFKVFPKVQERA